MSQIAIESPVTKRKGIFARAWNSLNSKVAKSLYKYVASPLLLWMAARGFAQAADLAAAGAEDAGDTFGEGSSVMYYIMIGEAVLVFLAFMRAQNPALLLLIPVFIVGTKIVFGLIEAPSTGG
ncbi:MULTISPECIES: type IV conjugative transfer system pilin TraA [Providencia]|uniref:Conjugal transfer protein TraA n=1 Tax=Providencia huaxiensis TaxID=2027290 RepID=A0ABU2J3U2_9GAMM|nr:MULTISPECIES: type IV conjugative transfer system pilin TraA [Providencia]MDB9569292.1 type IV conjugative transfer system pilin TraA [Providencia rettgeri]MDT0135998.1 conjugal transfer protein TraA [Providencia huaxiensis]MDT1982403.1 conjugal transfer protein TraA [Providencia huaxiensis]TNU98952.1 conjugal transfer protein TraA [Providencia rettgeri]WOB84138.1 type IV conjugative transfer system pilin TraA [Providencia sp. PROV114]